jgi:GTPase Era involved in 16S rRNA processing
MHLVISCILSCTQFINTAIGHNACTIGHELEPQTTDIQAVRANHPTTREPVIFVDTPGFDNSEGSYVEILTLINGWLMKM